MTDERDVEIARLRDALAGLMGRNIELEQRIQTLEQERNELGVDEMAGSLIRAAHVAEAAMDEASANDVGASLRFVIPRLDVAIRGMLGRRGDGFGIRFPGPEERAAAAALSTISMTVTRVPIPPIDRQHDRFGAGLEAAQAALSGWERDRGRAAAGEIVAGATQLLSLRAKWGDVETVAGIRALADALQRFDTQAGTELEPAARDRHAASSKVLSALARRSSAQGRASPEDLAAIGSALVDLANAVRAVRE